MYVTTPGARVGRDGDRIVVTQGGERIADRRLIDVSLSGAAVDRMMVPNDLGVLARHLDFQE